MSQNNQPYGSPNPYADSGHRNFTQFPAAPSHHPNNVGASAPPGYPSPHPNLSNNSQVPPPRHTGRLANRFRGITVHQNPPAQPPDHGAAPGGMPLYPQAQYSGSYMQPGQGFGYAPPPMTGDQSRHAEEPAAQFPSMSSLHGALPQQAPAPAREQPAIPPQRPGYLVVGLFALRITRRLIQQLDPYEDRDAHLRWLDNFLQPYHAGYALAKLKDLHAVEDYVQEYPKMVKKMIKQKRYRRVFMDMNPDRKVTDRELTDEELLAMIDFADAAGEWGSVVPMPGKYASRMEDLASGRRVAD